MFRIYHVHLHSNLILTKAAFSHSWVCYDALLFFSPNWNSSHFFLPSPYFIFTSRYLQYDFYSIHIIKAYIMKLELHGWDLHSNWFCPTFLVRWNASVDSCSFLFLSSIFLAVFVSISELYCNIQVLCRLILIFFLAFEVQRTKYFLVWR